MYLLIDNYDSFTYNLYQAFADEGIKLLVKRNDEIGIKEIARLNPEKIIISPGPKTPDHAGISNKIIEEFGPRIPILGVCLGHQCIAAVFGGKLARVRRIVHGKSSPVHHNGKGIFRGIPSPFMGARYHSLKTVRLPRELEITARTADGTVMAVRHRKWPLTGLQFHPESFLTENGRKFIKNFIDF
ncbi:MAG: aminodeoxychorismate/anthranilate synthase component II [Candidatus Omnitrophota bacterium]